MSKKEILNLGKNEEGVYAFKGKYRFLSNFSKAEVEMFGIKYPTTEHAYQAAKAKNLMDRQQILDAKKQQMQKK